MPLHGIDHVELWVGNAAQAAYFYTHALGFREVAYAGLETGVRDRTSHVLEQGRIRLVLTGALHARTRDRPTTTPRHGDGVKVIALSVPDADARLPRGRRARRHAASASRGRRPTSTARCASPTIATYGETLHTFVERSDYTGPFLPGYAARRATHGRRPASARASTTSSATSSSATWRRGSSSTRTSSG